MHLCENPSTVVKIIQSDIFEASLCIKDLILRFSIFNKKCHIQKDL